MADFCICCGKKMNTFLTGSHLDNKLCDNCYIKIDGYITEIENCTTSYHLNMYYDNAIKAVGNFNFSDEGYDYVIHYFNTLKSDLIIKIGNTERQKNIIENFHKLKDRILLTTGVNFDGYSIIKYCGVYSGSIVLGTGLISEFSASVSDFLGTKSNILEDKLEEAKDVAMDALIKKCLLVEANGIIGIDYNIMTIGADMIVVFVNGTAVKVEKTIS